MAVPFVDVRVGIGRIWWCKPSFVAQVIPALRRDILRGGDRHFKAIIHGFVIGFDVRAIKPADEGI